MQRWRGLEDIPEDWGRSVVTIGSYDGVHRGHQLILRHAVERARELGVPSVAVTFDPHPSEVVRPGTHPPLLAPHHRRAELMAELGVDAVLILPFTTEFSRLSPADFVVKVLVDKLHAKFVVEGPNFRFGHKAAEQPGEPGYIGEGFDQKVTRRIADQNGEHGNNERRGEDHRWHPLHPLPGRQSGRLRGARGGRTPHK